MYLKIDIREKQMNNSNHSLWNVFKDIRSMQMNNSIHSLLDLFKDIR
jgi:hypothetical protein